MLGMARTGSPSTHGSGDYVIAFSTAPELRTDGRRRASRTVLADDSLTPLFEARGGSHRGSHLQLPAEGRDGARHGGRTAEALPVERVRQILRKYGR